MQERPQLLLKKKILLVNCHLYQAVLPHLLLLLEEAKGLQLVLVFTLIIQLELKYLMYVHLICLLCFGVYSDSHIMILPYLTLYFFYYNLVHQVRRFYMGQQN